MNIKNQKGDTKIQYHRHTTKCMAFKIPKNPSSDLGVHKINLSLSIASAYFTSFIKMDNSTWDGVGVEYYISYNGWRVPEVTWVGNNPFEIVYMEGE